MLGLGLASSHAPMLFEPLESWVNNVNVKFISQRRPGQPFPPQVEQETEAVARGYMARIDAGFTTLRRQLEAYRPDALIMIGDDQGDMFDDSNNPTFSIFIGEGAWGICGYDGEGPNSGLRGFKAPMQRADYKANPKLAAYIGDGLVQRGFDLATLTKFEPRGGKGRGISHMVANLVPMVDPNFEIPMIPIFLNEYFPPLPSAERCYDLGVALREILAERPERIAIYASGGLSHLADGSLPVAYIDESFDRWVLRCLERNEGQALKQLFTFDADTLHGGTGETRAWISVAGAMNRPAKVVDYIPAYRALTGLAFSYWEPMEN